MDSKKRIGVHTRSIGAASGILHEVGRLLGIGEIIKRAGDLPAIKERLKEVDEEIGRRLSEEDIAGLRKAGAFGAGRRGIPAVRPVVKEPKWRESEPDIFDEDEYLLIVLETPGMEEGDFKINLDGDLLTIGVEKAGGGYRKTVKLPCAPLGEAVKTYKNGILEVRIMKQKVEYGL